MTKNLNKLKDLKSELTICLYNQRMMQHEIRQKQEDGYTPEVVYESYFPYWDENEERIRQIRKQIKDLKKQINDYGRVIEHIGVVSALCNKNISSSTREDLPVSEYKSFEKDRSFRFCRKCLKLINYKHANRKADRPGKTKGGK